MSKGNTEGLVTGQSASAAVPASAANQPVEKPSILESAKNSTQQAIDNWVERNEYSTSAKIAGALSTGLVEIIMPTSVWEIIPVGKAVKLVKKGAELAGLTKKGEKAAETVKDAKKAEAPPAKGKDGGTVKQKKQKKKEKPSDCCPKGKAPGGKAVKTPKPVHLGTGEEILDHTDFVLDGTLPIVWSRTYRSGSECEDWGLLGARWATPFTSSLSQTVRGIVYHEDTGRALRLPSLTPGQEHDHKSEGFILHYDNDSQFTLTWRDGSTDTFTRGPDAWLPHGYDGVNAMLAARSPLACARFYLSRSAGRDGRGISIERLHDAKPGEVLLRLKSDDGQILEALRAEEVSALVPSNNADTPPINSARIGRIEEVRADGTRLCHVSYRYETATEAPTPATELPLTPAQTAFATLPQRHNLSAQSNLNGDTRTYTYQHHLLLQYTSYSGFADSLEWVSLASLRERWANSPLSDTELQARHPITLDNSYQARAIRTSTADGNGEAHIAYIDPDTTRLTEADGGILEYSFNSQWLATEVRRIPPNGGPAQSLGRQAWDGDGNLTTETDAQGTATRYSYDAAGNLTSSTDARGNTTRIEYDSHNQPLAVTDALGHTTRRSFDDAGRLLDSTDALGHTTKYHYDAKGQLTHITDARGGSKQLEYDDAGRLTAYTDCSNYSSRYEYDAMGRLIRVADALGNSSRYQYDNLGRLLGITHPDQTTESYAYDVEGNLCTHTDPKGQITRYRYNGHDLPIERIDAQGQTLQYRYDRALRLSELINGNGETYRFSYDAESRLASETGFDGKTTTYQYDSAGQLTGSASGSVQGAFMRDALGQLLAKSDASGSVRYAYDALGRLSAVASATAEQRFHYDAVGQLIEERSAYTLNPPQLPGEPAIPTAAFKLSHSYDALGNRIQTTLPNGRRIDTQRYGSGHWHGTLWQGQSLVDLERDHLHRETQRQIGSSQQRLQASRSYDPQSRLTAITLNKGQQRLRERRYTYDETGNLTQIQDAQRGNLDYRYDPLGQLLGAHQPNLAETFAFDPAGNLLDESRSRKDPHPAESLDEQAAPGSLRLPKITHNLLRQYLGYHYDYDTQGNTLTKRHALHSANEAAALELAYDAENRLITATRTWDSTQQVTHYTYDAFGRRIAKQVTGQQGKTPSTTLFVWDGDVLVQEIQPDKTITYLYEPDSFVPLARVESSEGLQDYAADSVHLPAPWDWDGPQERQGATAQVYAWRGHAHQQQEALHQTQWRQRLEQAQQDANSDRMHYYQCDHLGTPLELTDEHGKIVWGAHYKAWGRILRHDVREVEQPLRFQGQYEDEETGLYYNRHRYYDPDSARYLTQDPIGLLGGTNLYQYASNPTAWVDPMGLAKKKCHQVLYRGGPDSSSALKSHGANKEGYANASEKIKTGDMNTMSKNHAIDSKAFKSPLISLTTDIRIAQYFATAGGTRKGVVYKLKLPCDSVEKNTHNNLIVPAGPGGSLISESEWILKRPYIRPSEIIGKTYL